MANFAGLTCSLCGGDFGDELSFTCVCGGMMLVRYRFDLPKRAPERPETEPPRQGIQRYARLLPGGEQFSGVSHGEGATILALLPPIGEPNLPNLYLKRDGLNPSGTVEDRGMACAIPFANSRGLKRFTLQSEGPCAVSAAAYAAWSGSTLAVSFSRRVSDAIVRQCLAFGAEVRNGSTLREPDSGLVAHSQQGEPMSLDSLRVEGLKTIAIEICEQLGWRMPDVIVCSSANRLLPVAIWKGFSEVREIGWASGPLPRIAVAGDGAEDELTKRALVKTRGAPVAVSAEDLDRTLLQTARKRGILLSVSGAASLAATTALLADKFIRSGDCVVVIDPQEGSRYADRLWAAFPSRAVTEESKLGGLIIPR